MGMRYNFKIAEGDIKLSGLMAEVCVDLGYWDPKDCVCTLSWLKAKRVEREMSKRENDPNYHPLTTILDLFKRSILCHWLATHEFKDEIVFS